MSDIRLADITKIEENLNDIADAIRLKTEGEEDIAFDDMAGEIAKIRVNEYAWEEPYIYKHEYGRLVISSSAEEYSQDGLTLYLDAINNTGNGHDANATTWIDLTGNGYNAIVGDNYRIVNDKWVQITAPLLFSKALSSSLATSMELVIKPDTAALTGSKCICPWGNSNYVAVRDGQLRVSSDASKSATLTDKPMTIYFIRNATLSTIYINGKKAILNDLSNSGTFGTSYTDRMFGYNSTNTNSSYKFPCRIYAIRFYNRNLTTAEIIDNFVLDRKRFDLWQTIES